MRSLLVLCALATMALPSGLHAQTDIYLRAERIGRGKIPIVVRNIRPVTQREAQVAGSIAFVIRQDLDFSGFFAVVSPAKVDSIPGGAAGAFLDGSLASDGTNLVLDATLIDGTSGETIFSKRYRFAPDAKRTIAHTVSDEVVYYLVGERGIATTRILYSRRDASGGKSIFVVDYDGFGERALTRGELAMSPLWLDAGRVCFMSYKSGNPDCYLVDLRQGRRILLSDYRGLNLPGSYFAPRDEIAVTLSIRGDNEVYLMSSTGKVLRRLTRNRAIDVSPSWSPNGAEIAFNSDRAGTPQVFIMDRYGGGVRRLTRGGSYNTSPAWSPRGDMIAYASREGGLYRLKLISPDGLVEENLFEDNLSYEDPAWAPNGRQIVATVRYGGTPWLVVVDVDTGEKRRLVQGESADWSPLSPLAAGAGSAR